MERQSKGCLTVTSVTQVFTQLRGPDRKGLRTEAAFFITSTSRKDFSC